MSDYAWDFELGDWTNLVGKPVRLNMMTPEEEQLCWARVMWSTASRGEDPSLIYGGAQAISTLFRSACIDLNELGFLFRSVSLGNFTLGRMFALTVNRDFNPANWNLK